MPDPLQKPLTDPDQWMQSQQNTGGLTDPDQWMQKAQAQPKGKQKGYLLGDSTKPATIGPGPSQAQEVGQHLVDYLGDPKIMLPTLATAAAAPFTAGMSLPASATIMGGANAAGTAVAHGVNSYFDLPQPPLKDEALGSFGLGALPEIGSWLSRGPKLFTKTPLGEQAQQLLGDKAGLHEVADHPVIDFMHNIATAGMGGSGRMERAKAARSVETLHEGILTSEQFAPPSGAKALVSPEWQGQDIRNSIVSRAGDSYGKYVEPLYKDFGENGMFGGLPVMQNGQYRGTVNQILAERSKIGQQMAKLGTDGSERMQRAELSKSYGDLTNSIEQSLPARARTQWAQAKKAHQIYSKAYENPVVAQILQSPTKENEILSLMYNPQGGGDLGGKSLQTWDKPVASGGRRFEVSHSNRELVQQAKIAMGPEEWQHTAVAAAQHIIEMATNENGILDGAKLKRLFDAADPEITNLLFGGGSKIDNLNNFVNTVAYAERKPKTAAGTLFINIRQGAAIVGGLGAVGSAVGGLAGGSEGAKEGGIAGAVTGGALLLAPNVMARILTSPTARDWLAKSAQVANPTMKDKMVNMAIKTSAQGLVRGAEKAADKRGADNKFRSEHPLDIPNPPSEFFTPPGR